MSTYVVAIFGFVWTGIIRGLTAQLENLYDHESRGPHPVNKERR